MIMRTVLWMVWTALAALASSAQAQSWKPDAPVEVIVHLS